MAGQFSLELNYFTMKKDFYTNVDGLIQGIESIVSLNRCSISDEEKVLLVQAIDYLNEFKRSKRKKPINWKAIAAAVELLLKVLTSIDYSSIL